MIAAAGRSRLLQLRRELATARDSRALLDRKREAILRTIGDRLPDWRRCAGWQQRRWRVRGDNWPMPRHN